MKRTAGVLAIIAAILLTACAHNPATHSDQSTRDEVRFVVWGDSQFANKPRFERLVHETNLLRPAFVLQVGDMIHGYTYDEPTLRNEWQLYKTQIEPLTMPFHPVPGNHDVVTTPSEIVYGETWGTDKYVYSVDDGPVHCIVLDSYYGEEDDRIAEWQRQWLAEDLAQHAARNGGEGSEQLAKTSIFVLLHSPLWRYGDDTPGRQDWNEIHTLFQRYPVRLVVGGHTHEYVWENRDGIDYLVINSSGGMSADNERGGMFHCFLHVSVIGGNDVRYAVMKAGSVLPIDTVDSSERGTIPRHALRGGTLRVPEWQEGNPFTKTFDVQVSNPVDQPRLFRLQWNVPHGAEVMVEPQSLWLELEPRQTVTQQFFMETASAPDTSLMPALEISATSRLRTGIVSREWEQAYIRRAERADAGESIIPTNIELEAPFRFEATHTLFVPPVATATRKRGAIKLDGILDETGWAAAQPVTQFNQAEHTDPAVRTAVRFLYDDNYLYVGAWLEEPNPSGMRAQAEGDIPLTWSDDDFELFFDPQNTTNLYTRLFQNCAGTRFNSLPRNVEDKYFKSEYKSAIHVGEDYWSLEMRIPWDEMTAETAPTPGTEWSINIGRHRQQSEPAQIYWSGSGLYNPDVYGLLRFR